MQRTQLFAFILTAMVAASLSPSALGQRTPLAEGVTKICAIDFNKDAKRPARVEDTALPCLQQAANLLKTTPGIKLLNAA